MVVASMGGASGVSRRAARLPKVNTEAFVLLFVNLLLKNRTHSQRKKERKESGRGAVKGYLSTCCLQCLSHHFWLRHRPTSNSYGLASKKKQNRRSYLVFRHSVHVAFVIVGVKFVTSVHVFGYQRKKKCKKEGQKGKK